jgi:microsomal prostaglandin-E synthase 1
MTSLDPNHAPFVYYLIAAALLALQLLGLSFYTGLARTKAKKVLNPEDARTVIRGSEVVEVEAPEVARIHRAHRNALENAVPFFVIGLLYVLTQGSKLGALAYFGTFTLARLLHSLFYLGGVQPWRTATFAIGALATIGMAVHVLRVAFGAL